MGDCAGHDLPQRWRYTALARNLRRSWPGNGRDDFQQRRRRLVGMGRRPELPREVLCAWNPNRRQLRHVFHDALMPMRQRTTAIALGLAALSVCGALFAQKEFKEWPAIEYDDFPLPKDYQQKAEWTRARLRYPDIYGYPHADLFMQGGRP